MRNYRMKYFYGEKLVPGVFLKGSVASKFKYVRDCYQFLLGGGAGKDSLHYALAIACSVFDQTVIRKLAVAYCRRVSWLFPSGSAEKDVLAITEQYITGGVSDGDLGRARTALWDRAHGRGTSSALDIHLACCAEAVSGCCPRVAVYRVADIAQTIVSIVGRTQQNRPSDAEKEMFSQLAILSELGNPFNKDRKRVSLARKRVKPKRHEYHLKSDYERYIEPLQEDMNAWLRSLA